MYNRSMSAFQPPKVLILASTEESHGHICDALAGAAEIICRLGDGGATDLPFDVLITDLSSDAAEKQSGVPICRENEEHWGRPKVTVLGVGPATAAWADLALSEDFTPRELRLACTLLGEISRLRAQRDEAAQAGHENRQLANTDPLTALPNRRAWDSQLETLCRRAEAAPFWLAIADLDGFKPINDRCGLAVGDSVLKRVAESLAHSVRRDDLVARLGGDEFGVLLGGIDETTARNVLDRLRRAVADLGHADQVGPVTVSIGYAKSNGPGLNGAELLAAAERGLRRAKQAGGNCVCSGDI